jgi:hypothetical protein
MEGTIELLMQTKGPYGTVMALIHQLGGAWKQKRKSIRKNEYLQPYGKTALSIKASLLLQANCLRIIILIFKKKENKEERGKMT